MPSKPQSAAGEIIATEKLWQLVSFKQTDEDISLAEVGVDQANENQ